MFRPRTAFWRWLPASIVAMLAACCILLICESAGSPPSLVTPDKEIARGAGPRTGALLLNNGRLVEGRISESANGYVVDFPNGSMLVPFAQVRLEGKDRRDAFRRYRDTITSPTASTHLALARWCIINTLYEDAFAELQSSLKLEPENKDARATLKRLEELLRQGTRPENSDEETPGAGRSPKSGVKNASALAEAESPDIESIGGLSRAAAREWIAHVQPLLVNKCGNASCHGGTSSNGLRLARVNLSVGLSRGLAERNLASALKYVNRSNPDQSLLIVTPRGNHGRTGRTIFVGQQGGEQYRILRRWVREVARSQGPAQSASRPGIALGKQVNYVRPVDHPPASFDRAEEPSISEPAESENPKGQLRSRSTGRNAPRSRTNSRNRKAPALLPKTSSKNIRQSDEPTPAMRLARQRQENRRIVQEMRAQDAARRTDNPLSPDPETESRNPAQKRKIPPADAFDPDEFNSLPPSRNP